MGGDGAGVAWYREADWPRIKELFPDADQLHESYAEWLKFAEESVKRLARTGATVEPVVIDIDDFLGWCLVHDRLCDAKARTEYVVLTKLNYAEIMAYVTAGHLVMLEATYLTATKSFAEARDEGRANLRSPSEFDSLLDIQVARTATPPVTPLPIINE